MTCPILNNPKTKQEFQELKDSVGDALAYYLWDKNNGYHLDKAPNGKESKLFKDLLELTNNRNDAIKIKAKTFTQTFKNWFGDSKVVDENGEPLIVYHGSRKKGIYEFKGYFSEDSDLHSGYYFAARKGYANAYKRWTDGDLIAAFLSSTNFMESEKEIIHDNVQDIFQENPEVDALTGIDDATTERVYVVKSNKQIKSIFNQGDFNLTNPNIYDNTAELEKIQVTDPMTQIMQNFEKYFPDLSHYNQQQRQDMAELVEQGHVRIEC